MGRHLLVVFTNAVEGQEDRYNTWYDETHVPDLLGIPGVVSARRLELAPVGSEGIPPPPHKYLALYEIDGDPAAVMDNLNKGVASGDITISDALDTTGVGLSVYSYRDQGDR
jgi:hypothetical protein